MVWIAVGLIQRWTINDPASAFSELVDSPLLAGDTFWLRDVSKFIL